MLAMWVGVGVSIIELGSIGAWCLVLRESVGLSLIGEMDCGGWNGGSPGLG